MENKENIDENVERAMTLVTELAINFMKFSLWPLEWQSKYVAELTEIREIMRAVFNREQTYQQTKTSGN
jgi:hypothetical protein